MNEHQDNHCGCEYNIIPDFYNIDFKIDFGAGLVGYVDMRPAKQYDNMQINNDNLVSQQIAMNYKTKMSEAGKQYL